MSEEKIEYKVSAPMFENGELEMFDNNIHRIIEEYSKMMFKEKEQILTQRIIKQEIDNLKFQLQQKENIIKEIKSQLDYLETYSSKEDVYKDMKRRLNRIEKIIGENNDK